MKRSATVTLTMVAAIGVSGGLPARAQQPGDPCEASGFNAKACQVAVQRRGFCSQGAWIPMTYPQTYPYYYDLYRDYVMQGGAVSPVPDSRCSRPGHVWGGVVHGGFGTIGHGHGHSHAGG